MAGGVAVGVDGTAAGEVGGWALASLPEPRSAPRSLRPIIMAGTIHMGTPFHTGTPSHILTTDTPAITPAIIIRTLIAPTDITPTRTGRTGNTTMGITIAGRITTIIGTTRTIVDDG